MNKIAIYIDVEYHGSGVSQYIKSLTSALINLSYNNYELTIIYTKQSWGSYLKKHPEINSVKFLMIKLNLLRDRNLIILFSLQVIRQPF